MTEDGAFVLWFFTYKGPYTQFSQKEAKHSSGQCVKNTNIWTVIRKYEYKYLSHTGSGGYNLHVKYTFYAQKNHDVHVRQKYSEYFIG